MCHFKVIHTTWYQYDDAQGVSRECVNYMSEMDKKCIQLTIIKTIWHVAGTRRRRKLSKSKFNLRTAKIKVIHDSQAIDCKGCCK